MIDKNKLEKKLKLKYGEIKRDYKNHYLGRLETSEDFKVAEKGKQPQELRVESLKISVRELTDEDIKIRNLPNQTSGLVITQIDLDSPISSSIEKDSIILEAQKKKLDL